MFDKAKEKISLWWFNYIQKHKWADWIDDYVFWYLYRKPKQIYKNIKHWFYCNWNKEHWALLKEAFVSYGWDGSFLTTLEERQIDKKLKWFTNHQYMCDEQYELILRTLRWAKYLIHIINTEADDLYSYDGSIKFESNGNPIPNEDGVFEWKKGGLEYMYRGPKVNTNNLHRFLSKGQLKYSNYWKDHPHEVYIIKCKHLYYKLREYYTDYWWD